MKRRNGSKIWTLLRKDKQVEDTNSLRKGRTSRRYGPSSERRNKSKIWTLIEKEEKVEDISPPWTKGEHIDNMDPTRRNSDDDTIEFYRKEEQ